MPLLNECILSKSRVFALSGVDRFLYDVRGVMLFSTNNLFFRQVGFSKFEEYDTILSGSIIS